MPRYAVTVKFEFETTVVLDAPDATTAASLVQNADHDQVAHLNGKSFADVDEATDRIILSVTEVI